MDDEAVPKTAAAACGLWLIEALKAIEQDVGEDWDELRAHMERPENKVFVVHCAKEPRYVAVEVTDADGERRELTRRWLARPEPGSRQ
jgi:hypothetical protein